jgi:hypothetical protein
MSLCRNLELNHRYFFFVGKRPSEFPHTIDDINSKDYNTIAAVYFYTGTVNGIKNNDIILSDAAIVYDSGDLNKTLISEDFPEITRLPYNIFINSNMIISYTPLKTP